MQSLKQQDDHSSLAAHNNMLQAALTHYQDGSDGRTVEIQSKIQASFGLPAMTDDEKAGQLARMKRARTPIKSPSLPPFENDANVANSSACLGEYGTILFTQMNLVCSSLLSKIRKCGASTYFGQLAIPALM